jgi:hypothetical protein
LSIVAGSPSCGRTGKAKRRQIQFVNEYIHDPDQVVLADIVIQAIGKQQPLPRLSPSTKRPIPNPPGISGKTTKSGGFHTTSTQLSQSHADREGLLWEHEGQFAPPKLSGHSAFSEETFAGRWGNENAPQLTVR